MSKIHLARIISIGLLGITVLVSSCVQLPRGKLSCDQIVDSKFNINFFESTTIANLPQWIEDEYKVNKDKLVISDQGPKATPNRIVSWDAEGKGYVAYWSEPIKRITILPTIYPKVQEIVSCFGDPEYYYASRTKELGSGATLVFELWYPQKGLYFSYLWSDREGIVSRIRQQPEQINNNTYISDIIITQPLSIRDMINTVFLSRNATYINTVMRLLTPWPSHIEDVHIAD